MQPLDMFITCGPIFCNAAAALASFGPGVSGPAPPEPCQYLALLLVELVVGCHTGYVSPIGYQGTVPRSRNTAMTVTPS